MAAKHRIRLSGTPLSTTVLNARRHRLETRWRDCLVVAGLLGAAFSLAVWYGLHAETVDAGAFGSVGAVVLAILLVFALQVLVLNYIERLGLLPATASQLELVGRLRNVPRVSRYLAGVAAHGRQLTRAEAGAVIMYGPQLDSNGGEHVEN